MWQRCFELRVCKWPDYNALLSNRKKLCGSCVPYVARFNDVTADQTWGKLNMWQTGCMCPLPLILKPPVECWLFHKHFDPSYHCLLATHQKFLRSLLASSIYCPLHASFFLSRMSRQTCGNPYISLGNLRNTMGVGDLGQPAARQDSEM